MVNTPVSKTGDAGSIPALAANQPAPTPTTTGAGYFGRFKKGPRPPGQTWDTDTTKVWPVEVVWFGGQIGPEVLCAKIYYGFYPLDDIEWVTGPATAKEVLP